eukprot:CAMPEP_0172687862 /NCGR_PEP_ID=MMETSP1074-20121228/22013_1 /TAXON_ID=2916 /ORGANISM="Ceratium fusus, Strain PA161109" /LENGTH=370 /DNA_ID=CAMNT_0013507399 /DNA_START=40 /DNA_END=1152 /DNA_ORIENTATION=+
MAEQCIQNARSWASLWHPPPMGLLLLLSSAVVTAAVQPLLIDAARGHGTGFPFIIDTVFVFPFFAQSVLFFVQLIVEEGSFGRALQVLKNTKPYLGQCFIYSAANAVGNIIQALSQGYMTASSFVILRQSRLLVSAFLEAYVLGVQPTPQLVMVLLLLFGSVTAFNIACSPTLVPSAHDHSVVTGYDHSGEVFLFIGVTLISWGVVLQQRFMQREALEIPLAAKLFYQHVFSLLVLVLKLTSSNEARSRILHEGLFAGWDVWAWSATMVTWIECLAFSFVVAKFSAMAAIVTGAVSVILTCTGDILMFGRPIKPPQVMLMGLVTALATLYGVLKSNIAQKNQGCTMTNNKFGTDESKGILQGNCGHRRYT